VNPQLKSHLFTFPRMRFRLRRLVPLALIVAMRSFAGEPTSEPLLRLETGMHTGAIRRIATDAAGHWMVTASHDKTARVWEVATGRQLMVLRPPQDVGKEGKLYTVAMSPDGSTVATGGWTGYDWDQQNSIYLFDRASGQLTKRISGLPNVVLHLAFSQDGRLLIASLWGQNGIRLFDAVSGVRLGQDAEYGSDSYSAHFRPDGRRLVTTSWDGSVRLYSVENEGLKLLIRKELEGGKRPYFARFSPDGRRVAVGFDDTRVVQVLDATTLSEVARPSTDGVGNGNLFIVTWSGDGAHLFAAGRWDKGGGQHPVRRWPVGDWSRYEDFPVSGNTIMGLAALTSGSTLFAAQDPTWGILDADGKVHGRQDAVVANLRGRPDQLRVSADGRRVRFGYLYGGKDACVFDLATGSFGPDDPSLPAARTEAPGLTIKLWQHYTNPTLNGKRLELERNEASRSVAIAPDESRFALGADWHLRFFDREGKEIWPKPVAAPDVVWAVTISGDSRFVVAGYGDGTIRWHRVADGKELLAFFPHADRKQWIAWTPEGFFSASPGAEDLIGFHLNRGKDREGEFVSARQLWETFYQPGLIASRLDADGDERIAAAVKQRGDVRELLKAGQTPELELLSPVEAESEGPYTLKVQVKRIGSGEGRLVVRVDGQELKGRWQAPALTPGGVVELPVDLAGGQRKVSVELVDGRGIGSKPVEASVTVNRATTPESGTLHVLAVGVSEYLDGSLKLKHAAADAEAVAKGLQERGGLLFHGRLNVRTLVDKQANVDQIEKTLDEMAKQAGPEDTFVLFMAGHGTTLDEDYYFMPWELEYENDDSLRKHAISQAQLRDWMAMLPTRSLLLLDTCRAGSLVELASRGAEDKRAVSKLIRLSERAVIVATSAGNIALEGHEGHGVFTWALLDALQTADYDQNGRVDVTDIATHVKKLVPPLTEKKFRHRQIPMQDTPGEPFAVAMPLSAGRSP
jgi:WD40 repeat protein